MAFKLEPLEFAYDALEPIIDKETVSIHHDKHHQTYVNNLNKAIEGTVLDEANTLEEVILNLDKLPEEKRTAARNNVGGHYNHSYYWETMIPGGAKEPVGNLADAINKKYGDFESFKKEFDAKGAGRFGSGWVTLVKKNGEIDIITLPNQDTALELGYQIIIINDVWEHAYYLKYQNRRPDYLNSWWEVVNWDIAEKRYNA